MRVRLKGVSQFSYGSPLHSRSDHRWGFRASGFPSCPLVGLMVRVDPGIFRQVARGGAIGAHPSATPGSRGRSHQSRSPGGRRLYTRPRSATRDRWVGDVASNVLAVVALSHRFPAAFSLSGSPEGRAHPFWGFWSVLPWSLAGPDMRAIAQSQTAVGCRVNDRVRI